MAMAAPIVQADSLTKRYRGARGVEGLTFEVEPGEVLGCLGPNGAGKTTTIRLLVDLIRPTDLKERSRGCRAAARPKQRFVSYE